MTVSPASTGARDEAYRLSRIQAEGWNAAHRVAEGTLDRLDATQAESLNPYASDPERTRWSAGFTSALVR
jgi:lipase chaperone LimK